MHRDAGEETRRHRDREKIGQPAGPKQPDQDEHRAHQDGEHPGEAGIIGATRGRHRRQPAGEDGRDGGIGADRDEAIGAEGGKGERPGGEGIETRLRWHAGQPRGRELPGNGDRRQHEPGDEIARQPGEPVAAQRCEKPGRHRPPRRVPSAASSPASCPLACCRRRVRRRDICAGYPPDRPSARGRPYGALPSYRR